MSYISTGQAAEILRDAMRTVRGHLERGRIGLAQMAAQESLDATEGLFAQREADLEAAVAMFERELPKVTPPLNPVSQRDGS